jgi:hypothetical protein
VTPTSDQTLIIEGDALSTSCAGPGSNISASISRTDFSQRSWRPLRWSSLKIRCTVRRPLKTVVPLGKHDSERSKAHPVSEKRVLALSSSRLRAPTELCQMHASHQDPSEAMRPLVEPATA